jgi:hypothetical protein
MAILFFGWNEMIAVLWNPIYLVLGLVCFLVGWQLYSELDVDSEMQRGTITGMLSIYNNLGDALKSVSLCALCESLKTGTMAGWAMISVAGKMWLLPGLAVDACSKEG